MRMTETDFFDRFFNEGFICQVTGYSRKTLANLRSEKRTDKYPPCVKIGKHYYYPKDLFIKWASSHGYPI
jgi:hypothetical protein